MGGWRAKQRAKNVFFWKKQGFLKKNISMSYNSYNLHPKNEVTLNKTQSTKDQNILSINRKTKQGLLYGFEKKIKIDRFEKSLNSLKSGFK